MKNLFLHQWGIYLLLVICFTASLPGHVVATPTYQADDPQTQANTLFGEGEAYFQNHQLQSALAKFEEALPFYQKADDHQGEALCLLIIGIVKHRLADYQGALDAYQASLMITQRIGNRDNEIITLNNIGVVYENLGQYDKAVTTYLQVIKISRDIGDQVSESDTLSVIGKLLHVAGNYEQALEYYQISLSIKRKLGLRVDEFELLNNIGIVYEYLQQNKLALEYFQNALTIARELGLRDQEGILLADIGEAYKTLAQYNLALEAYRQALAIRLEVEEEISYLVEMSDGVMMSEDVILNDIADIYARLGQYEHALSIYQQALTTAQENKHQAVEGTILIAIARAYSDLGEYKQALATYEKALPIMQEIGHRTGEGMALNGIGWIYFVLGKYELALSTYQKALPILQKVEHRLEKAATLTRIGLVLRQMEQYEQALTAFQEALTVQVELGDQAAEAATLTNIGLVYDSLGQYEQALAYFQKALTIWLKIGERLGESETLKGIAFTYEKSGNIPQAILYYQKSIETIESIRGDIVVGELQTSFYNQETATHKRLINLLWSKNQIHKAYEYVERAKARAFLDQIGNQQINFRLDTTTELIKQEQALRQQLSELQSALQLEHSKSFEQQNQELLAELGTVLEQVRREHEELIIHLKLVNPEYSSFVSVNTLSLNEVQRQVLDEQTTLIEYFVMDEHTLAWVIDKDGFKVVPLDITRKYLIGQIRYLNDSISAKDFDDSAATGLYNMLFASLKPHIRHTNLIIVPHDVLHYLPFAALKDTATSHYLIQDYAITFAPSASVLKFILDKRNPNQNRLLAMGNPDRSLPSADNEVQAVAQLFNSHPLLGQQATESQIYTQASQIDILHLAAHGVYDPHNPLYTRIELAPADASNDGNLEVHEVYGLDLTGVNLVVLSACDTALGQQSRGDELVGLTRAFLYAGAPAVVTTLWSINDAASGALMVSFYRHLQAGMGNAEALRAAQLEVMAQTNWNSPYYWAAFTLTGDSLGRSNQ